MAKKTTTTETVTKAKKSTGPRWSIGCYDNGKGKLATCYVNAEGVPMPYEQPRVAGREILFFAVYTGMLYREARAKLIREAGKAGIKPEPVAKEKPKAKPQPKAKTTRKRTTKAKPKDADEEKEGVSRSLLPKSEAEEKKTAKAKTPRKPRKKKATSSDAISKAVAEAEAKA